jgi:predicted signal transduction protein with EAL and GGDEF domain
VNRPSETAATHSPRPYCDNPSQAKIRALGWLQNAKSGRFCVSYLVPLAVGASAGVVLIGALDASAELLFRADAAMYARKGARRGEPSQLAQSRNVTR